MRLAERLIGQAAAALDVRPLSDLEMEFTTGGMGAVERRENVEQFLYYHLECARRARVWMDNAKTWDGEYVAKYRERELALAAAARRYLELQQLGGITPDLARRADIEGLQP